MTAYLAGLTDVQLQRFYNQVYRRMADGDGYQPYGYDWPTLRTAYPGWYAILKPISAEMTRRNEAFNRAIDARAAR